MHMGARGDNYDFCLFVASVVWGLGGWVSGEKSGLCRFISYQFISQHTVAGVVISGSLGVLIRVSVCNLPARSLARPQARLTRPKLVS